MKQKKNGGFSLIETVVAIAILGLITVPCTSGLLLSIRLNEKAQQMMQAQLAVSSAVETLMAEGIDQTIAAEGIVKNQVTGETSTNKIVYDFYFVTFEEKDGGYTPKAENNGPDRYPGVVVKITPAEDNSYCHVWVGDDGDNLAVDTYIRTVESQREVPEA